MNHSLISSKYIEINGSKIHYLEAGEGRPILFLHGIPHSSYVWRNIIPHLAPLGRCIAPDLIGFGQSAKPNIEYTVSDHIQYIEQLIKELSLRQVTLIMHGFGSVIGFDYAMRHEENCMGLVFYEAFLRVPNGLEESLPYQEQCQALMEQEDIAEMVMDGSAFIDKIIPQQLMKKISKVDLDVYRQPFLSKGSGKPILQYLQELPKGDHQGPIDDLIKAYSKKLTRSLLPKLMLYSVPGFITTIAMVMWAKEHLPNIEVNEIGEELHLAQEAYPQLMGETISVWLQGIEQVLM